MAEASYSTAFTGGFELTITLERDERKSGWKYCMAVKYCGAEILTVTGPPGGHVSDKEEACNMAVRVAAGALRAMQVDTTADDIWKRLDSIQPL